MLPIADVLGQGSQEASLYREAYLLFPVCLEGSLLDVLTEMQTRKEFFPSVTVLHIFRQVGAIFSKFCVFL
jgi:serine/threonine kinase 16